IGAELAEGQGARLVDLALSGAVAEVADGLTRLPRGAEAIPVVRALQRRLLRKGAPVELRARPGGARRGIDCNRPGRSDPPLDRLARQPLADHVQLIEAAVGQRDG